MKALLSAAILTLLMTSFAADAKPPKDKGGKPNKEQHEDKERREDLRDLEDGLGAISSLISASDARNLAVSHNMTGQKPLPPGIRKNLAKGKPLPPGIQKTRGGGSFFDDLPQKKGYEWRGAGTDLVLVQAGTEMVADVIEGVFE